MLGPFKSKALENGINRQHILLKPLGLFVITFLLLSLLSLGCGSHSQSIRTLSPDGKKTEIGEEKDPTLRLTNAVNNGDLDTVIEAIESGAKVDTLSKDGLPLLIIAIRAGQFAILEYLVVSGADIGFLTESEEFDPSVDAKMYVESLELDEKVKAIYLAILNQEPFEAQALNLFLFDAVLFKNPDLMAWLLAKNADPNYVRKDEFGFEKDTPLIFMFSSGFEGDELAQLKKVFDVLIAHPDTDPSFDVFGLTAIMMAEMQLGFNPAYQSMVDLMKAK